MTYVYTILSASLQETADAAITWFEEHWGINKAQIRIEDAIDADINFRPTFVTQTPEHHLLCVEVAASIYSNTLDSVVLDCRGKGLPVKLFVAVPKGIQDPDYSKKLKAAKRAGVGVIEVDRASGDIIQNALSLSLSGVRPVDLSIFPKKHRESLHQAEQSFRDGQPSKACSTVYDELESCTRTFAKKCVAKNLWNNNNNLDIDKVAWATLVVSINRNLNRNSPSTKKVTPALLSRLHGITTHRNDSGHKPKNQKELLKRDRELRTRFETAVDLLNDFLSATKALKI